LGALAEPDSVFLNEESLHEFPVTRAGLDKVIASESEHLLDYRRRFHLSEMPALAGKVVLLVDDGLATGATAEAAAISVRKQNAKHIVVATPVASANAVERLCRVADGVEVLSEEPGFLAVGQYYREFAPTENEEVISLLREAATAAMAKR
jgi:putative phosphoribosyl transferase